MTATWFEAAVQYHLAGNLAEAEPLYRQILAVEPNHSHALSNLGVILVRRGQLPDAIECFRNALLANPGHTDARGNLARAYKDHGHALKAQRNLTDAIACYECALELTPDCVETLTNLGAAMLEARSIDKAASYFQRAQQLQPYSSTFQANLGVVLQEQGKFAEAVAAYQRALDLDGNNLAALDDLVHLLQHICSWAELDVLFQRIDNTGRSRADLLSPFTILSLPAPATAAEQLQCARHESLKYTVVAEQRLTLPPRSPFKPKITLGYLSVDFRKHAVAYLIAELFELHDRSRFEVLGYSYGSDDHSPLRRRLAAGFDRFVDVENMSFRETAQRIAADGVDILIDLTGYTRNHRASILAVRPAPIQVNYLGHPSTMGAPFMDYILVDDFIVPADQQPFFSEQLVHLPGCYQVNDRQREIAALTPTRAECGLPAEGFVFCDFNNTFKITARMFAVWMDLLKSVPGSVLWLFEGNRLASANLRREAVARGVAPERLVFAPRRPLPEHLARYRLADLFLDTFPYGSLTTASDALWAGCPLLALVGDTFVSRVAASCLRTIGLPELATYSLEAYRTKALELAGDGVLLTDLKARLASNRETTSLFNAERFTRNLEAAYTMMWQSHLAGQPPRGFAVPDRDK